MDKIEKILQELKIPQARETGFGNELRRRLIASFFNNESAFKLRFKIAAVVAAVFAVFFFVVMIKPEIASDINNFAFGKHKDKLDNILYSVPEDQANYNSIIYKSENGENPYKNLQEEKAYIIRKYKMQNNKRVMVVSEVPTESSSKVKKVY